MPIKSQERCQPKTALLEFARIRGSTSRPKAKEKPWAPERYLAFVLHAGDNASVRMIDLGEARRIDHTIRPAEGGASKARGWNG
jgi:hypothetical protein